MKNIKVLDVTLRDGGCVNNFNFGQTYMKQILAAQEAAGIDIIELGYIDALKGCSIGRTMYNNEQTITDILLKNKKAGTTYVAMIDYGKYDFEKLQPYNNTLIDGIRIAFHKRDKEKIKEIGRIIMDKGYKFFIQPMITLRYSDAEILQLIEMVNKNLSTASGFYIVDSFGEMRPNDMSRMMTLVDNNLISSMPLGFHSHNNLQLSYSNAIAMLQFPTNRELMIDSSIMGMGKGAGNLNTELLLEHLNLYYGKHYNVAPLLEIIDKVINQLHSEYYWGYAPEYYLSSINHCTPSYASHFYNKHMLPIDQVAELLSQIDEAKKISFDANYAEQLYRKFNEKRTIDDTETISILKQRFENKQILLIAPGKSILNSQELIDKYMNNPDFISISLNLSSTWRTDYRFITRQEILKEAINDSIPIITTSNNSKGIKGNVFILNYSKWITIDDTTHDSSSVIAINLLKACNVKKILLAGFDGFSQNINENYYNDTMRIPVSEQQAEQRNKWYKEFFISLNNSAINVEFITPSKYN